MGAYYAGEVLVGFFFLESFFVFWVLAIAKDVVDTAVHWIFSLSTGCTFGNWLCASRSAAAFSKGRVRATAVSSSVYLYFGSE